MICSVIYSFSLCLVKTNFILENNVLNFKLFNIEFKSQCFICKIKLNNHFPVIYPLPSNINNFSKPCTKFIKNFRFLCTIPVKLTLNTLLTFLTLQLFNAINIRENSVPFFGTCIPVFSS